ncbi:MAG: chromate transporter [Alphaproteobacteria bacterium]|nr:chromate transporter [Alphaproteobacteria bacterium]
MRPADVLPQLALHFALLSLIAVGGANTVVPEMHHWLVESTGWLSDGDFADLYAIAQVAPGPNLLIVTLLGWKLSGLVGALVATVSVCLPSGVLAYGAGQAWHRFRGAPWRAAIQNGLAPLTVGLVLATGYILARAADQTVAGVAVTAVTVALVTMTKVHPLLLLAVAGVLGAMGVV